MKKKISLVVPFVLAFIATILFLIDIAMDSTRPILIVFGAILTIFWVGYALVLRKFTEEGKKILENLSHKYEGKLSQTEWTQVYLKPSANHKHSIYNSLVEGENVRFYAKIQPNNSTSIWSDRLPYILLAVLRGDEWISDSTKTVKYGVKGFEEYFTLEE